MGTACKTKDLIFLSKSYLHTIHHLCATLPSSTMSAFQNLEGDFIVESDKCKYTDTEILSDYT